jgi:uncharacterized membrane protein
MQNTKHHAARTSRAAKKAVVLGTQKRNPAIIAIAAVVIIAVSAALGLLLIPGSKSGPGTAGAHTNVAPASATDRVTYAASLFDDGRAHYFHHADAGSGITIAYFILKSSDGVIRAAFDACDVCWPAGKGYVQDGDTMVCRNCGRRFTSVRINVVAGGCNPAPLTRTIDGGQVIIQVEDILQGRGYFDLPGKV